MNVGRVYALFLRYFILIPRDFNRWIDFFFWPFLDIILWGFMSFWVKQDATNTQVPLMILGALILWGSLYRANADIGYSFLDELWSQNLINLFTTPILISEWIAAVLLLGLIKGILIFAYSATLIYFIFSLNMLSLGIYLIPLVGSSLLAGWSIGFLATSIISSFGQRLQAFAWVLVNVFLPFSAVYYPVSSLPYWAQKVAYCLPMTYIFEGMRSIVKGTPMALKWWIVGCGLSFGIFFISALIFYWSFRHSRVHGLARLERFE